MEWCSDMRLPADYLVQSYQHDIFRAAFSVCGNRQDAEDAVQEAFFQYLKTDREFENESHIKAWLLRIAINKSKNILTSFWRKNRISWEEYMNEMSFQEPEDRVLVEAVMHLPQKYRVTIHLYYYEDYSVHEIAQILGVSESAVKNRLLRGRRMLKNDLKEAWEDDE